MHAVAVEDSRLLHSIPAARIALIERIARSAGAGGRQMPLSFVRSYFRGVGEEDLAARSPRELARAAHAHLKFASQRAPGRSLVRVFNPSPDSDGFECAHTLVLTVTDDMPFLVDSLGMAFSRSELAVHLIVHPVLQVRRDRRGRLIDIGANGSGPTHPESWQLYEIDRITDAAQLARLQRDLESTLADVRVAVRDWKAMRERVRTIIAALENQPPPLPAAEVSEVAHLLDWMEGRHFVFLGYRHYQLERGRSEDRLVPGRDSGLGILSATRRGPRGGATVLRGEVRAKAREPELLIITKANSTATVHRGELLDYVGIKTFDRRGRVNGEHRFLGLWTSTAYHGSPREIPVLRHKVDRVIEHFGLDPASHDGKEVLNVLETYPRDELFQAGFPDLIRIVRGVVNLYERRTVRLLVRRDPYHRFYSCLVYVPRDRYNTEVRERIEAIALEGFSGTAVESHAQISSSSHARVHVVVRTDPTQHQRPDFAQIERRIADAALTWSDRLREVLIERLGEARGIGLAARYRHAFPLAYEEDVTPASVIEDLNDLEALREQPQALKLNLYRPPHQVLQRVHLKIVKLGDPIPISDVLPMLENFGLRVISERPYELVWPEGGAAWIQDFELEHRDPVVNEIDRIEQIFRDAFGLAWSGAVENDGFNRLLLAAGLHARQVVMLRAYCRYLLQTGVPFSQSYMERTLAAHPGIAGHLVRLFETRFDPAGHKRRGNDRKAVSIVSQIRTGLDAVKSLDDDRILRAYLTLIQATLRTNYFQAATDGQPKPYLSFKFDPGKIPDLPLPKPKFEIFVYSPRVEGVHLRMGYVARGGLRWSDRREDFRTEVLGLMKAQNVKNTVIVPVGAKGGFVAKRLPVSGSREEVQAEVVACYQTFIRALLDLTDNIVAGRIVPPPQVVRSDGDDPYLVVAADKGTATFSDTANAISADYHFWLGDAFASGGSAGYDHKKMGITARGAWECVARHFRERGVDIQTTDFTVAGIGDMSGDVFGNGMLCSKATKLVAAFDHRHIFIDPAPGPRASFEERKRLFDLPRSSWADYDANLISKGGGVFARSAKEIVLSEEMRTLTGLAKERATPGELIRALLTAPVDLLFFGGIGTFIKSAAQSHAEAGDRTNDAFRVNGRDVKALVVGEGANLGVTQLGRIEYAREGSIGRKGGRIDTDAIDNSAGVDTSDHEVNLKILMSGPLRRGELSGDERLSLLTAMTDDVARLVLKDNYDQTLALSVAESTAARDIDATSRFMRELERKTFLDRDVEFLPTDEAMQLLQREGRGLTRPELAVILAYAKLDLYHAINESELASEPYFDAALTSYFPPLAASRFKSELKRHRLARDIVATELANQTINIAGPLFPHRMHELSNAPLWSIARAFALADGVFGLSQLKARICALDLNVPAQTQNAMMADIAELLRRLGLWFIVQLPQGNMSETIARYGAGFAALKGRFAGLVSRLEAEAVDSRVAMFEKAGVPKDVAEDVAVLPLLAAVPEIILLAEAQSVPADAAARVYFAVGALVGLDSLRAMAGRIAVADHWDRLALRRIVDDLYSAQRLLASDALAHGHAMPGQTAVDGWAKLRSSQIERTVNFLSELERAGQASIAKLALANSQVQKLAATPG